MCTEVKGRNPTKMNYFHCLQIIWNGGLTSAVEPHIKFSEIIRLVFILLDLNITYLAHILSIYFFTLIFNIFIFYMRNRRVLSGTIRLIFSRLKVFLFFSICWFLICYSLKWNFKHFTEKITSLDFISRFILSSKIVMFSVKYKFITHSMIKKKWIGDYFFECDFVLRLHFKMMMWYLIGDYPKKVGLSDSFFTEK